MFVVLVLLPVDVHARLAALLLPQSLGALDGVLQRRLAGFDVLVQRVP